MLVNFRVLGVVFVTANPCFRQKMWGFFVFCFGGSVFVSFLRLLFFVFVLSVFVFLFFLFVFVKFVFFLFRIEPDPHQICQDMV